MPAEETSFVGVRMPLEMRAQAEALASGSGMSLSEWIRTIVGYAIGGEVPNVEAGYKQARGIAIQLATQLLQAAYENLPQTYEEALARITVGNPMVRNELND